MNKQRWITVPKNYEVMEQLDYGIENSNNEVWEVSEIEFEELWDLGVFFVLNARCNIVIDDYETEWIETESLLTALEVLKEMLVICTSKTNVLKKLKKMILLAIRNNTCVAFDF